MSAKASSIACIATLLPTGISARLTSPKLTTLTPPSYRCKESTVSNLPTTMTSRTSVQKIGKRASSTSEIPCSRSPDGAQVYLSNTVKTCVHQSSQTQPSLLWFSGVLSTVWRRLMALNLSAVFAKARKDSQRLTQTSSACALRIPKSLLRFSTITSLPTWRETSASQSTTRSSIVSSSGCKTSMDEQKEDRKSFAKEYVLFLGIC